MKVRNFLEKKPGPVKLFGRRSDKKSPDQDKTAPEDEVKDEVTVDAADEGNLADKDNLEVTDKGKSRLTAITGNIASFFRNAVGFMRSLSPRMYLTVTLLGIMLVAATIGIVTALILHHADNLPLTAPYSNKDLVYQASEDTALAVSSALSSDLCVGKDNTSTGDIVLKEGESAALFDLEDKEVIFAKNMYEKIYPASITKIMTAILTLKYGNMDDVVTIMWRDLELESGSQVVGFHIGDQVTVRELLHGLLVHSGNDAAGLQDSDHYTTVYDIYLMLNEAIKYSDFVSIMQISVYNVTYTTAEGETKFVNLDSTDHYLTGEIKPPKDVVVLGGKTGTTSIAGHCLAIVSQNAFGQPYISIIVGAQTTEDLYEDMNVLLSEIN